MGEHDNQGYEDEQQEGDSTLLLPAHKHGRTAWRVLRIGCLGVLLLMCGLVSGLAITLQSGPVNIALPLGNHLKLGSDDFVLSNFSFHDGNTYYLDLTGGGVRNIVQVEFLEDSHTLQLVLHHSTKGDRKENRLLEMKLP
jgi:hypothetical protein